MTRRFFSFLAAMLLFFATVPVFAKADLNDTLSAVADGIAAKCAQNGIVAVLGFASPAADMSAYLGDNLTSILTQSGSVRVVTRQNMDKIEKELDFQMSGVVSDATALSICERIGAQVIVFGELKELSNSYQLQVKVLDVESAAYMLFKTYPVMRSSLTEQLLGRAAIWYKSAIGIAAEVNKNCVELASPAGGLSFDYSFARRVSAGLRAFVSYDVQSARVDENAIVTFEPLATLRVYVASPTGEPAAGMFLEAQCGSAILFVNDETRSSVSAGGAVGFRAVKGNGYIEPFLRGGYPYLFGAGIQAGVRF